MCNVTIDVDLPKTVVMSKDIVWIDGLTFRFPDGSVYQMVDVTDNSKDCCDQCVLNDPTTDAYCGLDTDPRFKYLACWGGDETEGQKFYYFKKLVD